jgi:hypothetical protein
MNARSISKMGDLDERTQYIEDGRFRTVIKNYR